MNHLVNGTTFYNREQSRSRNRRPVRKQGCRISFGAIAGIIIVGCLFQNFILTRSAGFAFGRKFNGAQTVSILPRPWQGLCLVTCRVLRNIIRGYKKNQTKTLQNQEHHSSLSPPRIPFFYLYIYIYLFIANHSE